MILMILMIKIILIKFKNLYKKDSRFLETSFLDHKIEIIKCPILSITNKQITFLFTSDVHIDNLKHCSNLELT